MTYRRRCMRMAAAPSAQDCVLSDNVRSCTFCHISHSDRIVFGHDTFDDAADANALESWRAIKKYINSKFYIYKGYTVFPRKSSNIENTLYNGKL